MSRNSDEKDVLIVGGGPGGMSAALWCAELGLDALLLEKESKGGGQLHWIHNPIRNYPGVEFANGAEAFDAINMSLTGVHVEWINDSNIARIRTDPLSVEFPGGASRTTKAIVIATGIRRRELNVPGEEEFRGKGILESGSKERAVVAGKRVAVIGGGDAALENALILSEFAEKVHLVHRRSSFSARQEFIDAVQTNPRIECTFDSRVEQINGDSELRSIDIVSRVDNRRSLEIDHLVIRIGVEPNSDIVSDFVERDTNGYIFVDRECRTSVRGIWAIGDVANPVAPTIATAVGMGATAAKSIAKFVRENE